MYYWAIHENGGPAHIAEAAVAIDQKVYSLGNYEWRGGNVTVDVCIFNIMNYKWSYPPERKDQNQNNCSPCNLDGYSTVVYDDKIYIWGGLFDGTACDALFCFDTTTTLWSKPEVCGTIPSSRIRHAASVIDHTMYIFGGLDANSGCITCNVDALDLITMEWRHVNTEGEPPCVEFPVAAAIKNRMYLFSECEDNGFQGHKCPGLMYLDTKTSMWHRPRTSGRKPRNFYDYLMFAHRRHLCLFIGTTFDAQGVSFEYLYRLNTDTDKWETIKMLGLPPTPGHAKLLVVVNDMMLCFGGMNTPSAFTTSYSGKLTSFDDDLHILHFAPSLRTLSSQAVLRHNLDTSGLPESLTWELRGLPIPTTTRSSL